MLGIHNPTLVRRREQELLKRMYHGGLRGDRERFVSASADRSPKGRTKHDAAVRRTSWVLWAVPMDVEV